MSQKEPPPGKPREPADAPESPARPSVLRAMVRSGLATGAWLVLAGALVSALLAIAHPDSPLPDEWNPTRPLQIAAPVTPLTSWKLNRTAGDPALCMAALGEAATVAAMTPLTETDQCGIADRVALSSVGTSRLDPVETRCATALRLAMWERHSVQPAARAILGTEVRRIAHIGSYNCRPMRTSAGISARMSTHATADAFDISGFTFADGGQVTLLGDWDDGTAKGRFLRAVRDGACDWFGLTLSPDFNALHADHFHLQTRGWGGCR